MLETLHTPDHNARPVRPNAQYDELGSFFAEESKQGHHGTVLVVDDDNPIRMALSLSLQKLGYEVEEAVDGESALAKARIVDPDVVLLDVSMPGIDGYEVCRYLREDNSTQMIPVLILTGLTSRSARLKGLEVGASDYVTKPFDIVELALKVRNHVAFRHLTRDLDSAEQIVFSIGLAVEARDKETGGHCERLAEWGVRLGQYLDLEFRDIVALRRAGYLHDIGKIAVPDSVLLKPGKLNEEEWAVMRQHPLRGYEMCKPLRTLHRVLPIIRHHHEKFDGSGYPDGLIGEEIPLLARIFQVIDAFDALTNDRSYRKALPTHEALAILRDETVRGFWEPRFVEALASLVEQES